MSRREFNELDFVEWLRKRCVRSGDVAVGIGDDAAVVRPGSRDVVITTDLLVDRVHFDSRRAAPEAIGYKAIAKNLSDIAAMGCLPEYAVVSVAFPRRTSSLQVRRIFHGLLGTARRNGVYIIGGDTVTHDGPLTINVAMTGRCDGVRPVTRDGSKPGDAIMVTGPLGGSIRSKHMTFKPRVKEGYRLNKSFRIHAMIDISDGLALDLWRICRASGVGAVLDESAIPVSRDAGILSRKTGRTSLDHALTDGEDYELLFTVGGRDARTIQRRGWAVAIGRCTQNKRLLIRDRHGKTRTLSAKGYVHSFK